MVEMNSIPWSPVLRYTTPLPMNRTPRFDRSAPTQVRFFHFAVRHTPPNQHDPIWTVGGPREVRFLRFVVRQTPPDEQDPVSTVADRTQGRFLRSMVREAPMNKRCSIQAGWLPMNTTTM